MKYGYCRYTNLNQQFLDTCYGIITYYVYESDEIIVFAYDEQTEIPYAPTLHFSFADSKNEAFVLANIERKDS